MKVLAMVALLVYVLSTLIDRARLSIPQRHRRLRLTRSGFCLSGNTPSRWSMAALLRRIYGVADGPLRSVSSVRRSWDCGVGVSADSARDRHFVPRVERENGRRRQRTRRFG
jgi:hypothetical protein